MIDLVRLIGRDTSIVPQYRFNHKITEWSGWVKTPYGYITKRDRLASIIYLKVGIPLNRALVYDSSGKQYLLLFIQGDLPKEFLLDYCKKHKIPYYN